MAAEVLLRLDEVVQVGAAVVARGGAAARGVEGPRILGVPGIPQVDLAGPGEGLTVPPGAGRHDAVEHVGAARHGLDQVERRADAHEIAGLVRGQAASGQLQRVEHGGLAFPPPPGRRRRSRQSPWPPARPPSARAGRHPCRPARCRTGPGPGSARPTKARLHALRPGERAIDRALDLLAASQAARRIRRVASECRRRAGTGSRWRAQASARARRRRCATGRRRPRSVILRSLARLMTWKPPESVRIGPSQRMKRVQAAEPGDALGARAAASGGRCWRARHRRQLLRADRW